MNQEKSQFWWIQSWWIVYSIPRSCWSTRSMCFGLQIPTGKVATIHQSQKEAQNIQAVSHELSHFSMKSKKKHPFNPIKPWNLTKSQNHLQNRHEIHHVETWHLQNPHELPLKSPEVSGVDVAPPAADRWHREIARPTKRAWRSSAALHWRGPGRGSPGRETSEEGKTMALD